MREEMAEDSVWRRPWLWVAIALAGGLLLGTLIGFVSAPAPAPQRTFTVVAYHWGFAVYDENGNEVPQIEVTRGTDVTLLVISAASLGHEVHEELMGRTIAAWENNTAFGGKTGPELMALMEEAETEGLLNHAIRIAEFGVVVETDYETPAPAQVTFVADKVGSFDILCGVFCGWGHAYMALTGGLVVS
ncbi:MAG: hypothetical protein ACE5LS_01995 [Thermoplasmata archaeon]